MESLAKKAISQMRRAIKQMDVLPPKKSEMLALLDKIEKKGGMAKKELDVLTKMVGIEEKQAKRMMDLAEAARQETDKFIKKTDKILADYSAKLNRL